MLPSSVRRVVAAAPQSPLLSSFTPTSTRAPAALAFACNPRSHQRRRYSSSKPSSPNDSPKGISDGQVTATPAQSTKQGGEKRRRKVKEAAASPQKLPIVPSVPSTQHVPQEALALSTFFSLHRPMSVTHSFPRTISDDAFAQIFAPRPKANKYTDVVSTLSQTVDQLEQPMQSLSLDGGQQDADAITDASFENAQKIHIRHPDGSESSVNVQLNAMSGQFLPFRPPPLPQPQSAQAEAGPEEAAAEAPQHRVHKVMFTLEESVDEDGQARIVAHSPQVIEDTVPRTFLERMALRQIRRERVRGQSSDMVAISVKRQRKLKMKKKKYKKLMKRTRNERRKLDRV